MKSINKLSSVQFKEVGEIMDRMAFAFKSVAEAQTRFNQSVELFYSEAHKLEKAYENTLIEE